jgi:hypothetical protein
MGEARRRRELQVQAVVPDDIKADITDAVCCVGLISKRTLEIGVTCMTRSVLGYLVMREVGLGPVEHIHGAMLFRPSPTACIWFCGDDNTGQLTDDGSHFHGHAWLEYNGDIIDFSARDWWFLGNDTWTVPPLPFVWRSKASLTGNWRPTGRPSAVGELWYGPWGHGPRKSISQLIESRRKVIPQAMPHIRNRIEQSNLKARIRDAMQRA